jgi:two-component system, chemotaxis family, protein-glutamate methylesterase/glutaminase
MTLDIGLPRIDGLTFLKKLMQSPLITRTVVISSATSPGSRLALEALEAGAIEVLQKPASGSPTELTEALRSIARTVHGLAHVPLKGHAASQVGVPRPQETAQRTSSRPGLLRPSATPQTGAIIGLGASTGGVAALGEILPRFPPHSPPIIVVQHMAAGFSAGFAARLAELCPMRVLEAEDGQPVEAGQILVAPGGERHLEVAQVSGTYYIALRGGDPVAGHRPSVDVFFASLARCAGHLAAACLLTGMGRDGAEGLAALRRAGGRTFAQDKATSAVWGMPAAAHELGAAEALISLERVPGTLLRALAARENESAPRG